MDDEQRPRQPAMAQPHEPGGETREREGGDRQASVPETGGIQMTSSATKDEAAGPGSGEDVAASEAERTRRRSFWR